MYVVFIYGHVMCTMMYRQRASMHTMMYRQQRASMHNAMVLCIIWRLYNIATQLFVCLRSEHVELYLSSERGCSPVVQSTGAG